MCVRACVRACMHASVCACVRERESECMQLFFLWFTNTHLEIRVWYFKEHRWSDAVKYDRLC